MKENHGTATKNESPFLGAARIQRRETPGRTAAKAPFRGFGGGSVEGIDVAGPFWADVSAGPPEFVGRSNRPRVLLPHEGNAPHIHARACLRSEVCQEGEVGC